MTTTQPHTLTYVQPLFLEQQHARDVFPRWSLVISCGVLAPAIVVLIIAAELGRRSLVAMLPGMLVATVAIGILAVVLRFVTATTLVETTVVQLRIAIFGWEIWCKTIPIARIQHMHLEDMTGKLSVLKYRIGEIYFMTRKTCVRLILPEADCVTIGSTNAQQLLATIRSATATSSSATEAPADSARERDRADRSRAR